MANLLQRLNELEASIAGTGDEPHINTQSAPMPSAAAKEDELPLVQNNKNYIYIALVVLIIVLAGGLYYIRPSFLLKRDKKKRKVINMPVYLAIVFVFALVAGCVAYKC